MITNAIELLHTTAAYQTAAMQLMVGEANFAASALEINETVPPVAAANTNDWDVNPPPHGLGGSVCSSNYCFDFFNGKLRSIHKYKWLQKISPPVTDLLELADRPSLLDTNTAYKLARQRLAALSVDVIEMEQRFPAVIFQVPARRRDSTGQHLQGVENNVAVPLFMVGWGNRPIGNPAVKEVRTLPPGPTRSAVFIEILGTTKEVIEFEIREPSLLKRPPLQLANAAELLGPTPPPRHFVERLFGGKDAYETVAAPNHAEVWLLTSNESGSGKRDRAGPVTLKSAAAKAFSDPLLDFNSYLWGMVKNCIPDYGARLRFTRGKDVVDVRLCFECDMLEVTFNGVVQDGRAQGENFDKAHDALVRALQSVFPHDDVVRSLRIKHPN